MPFISFKPKMYDPVTIDNNAQHKCSAISVCFICVKNMWK